jgi:hypothetical protein
MLKKTGDDPKFRSALSDALAYGANDVIMRKVIKLILNKKGNK